MKKIFSLILVMAVIFTVCVPVGAVSGTTKLLYSCMGYEDKDTTMFDGSMRPFSYSEEYAKSGKVSLKGTGSIEQSNGYLKLLNNVTFESGKTYSVKFNTMASESTARIRVKLYVDSTKSSIAPNGVSQVTLPIGTWGEYIGVFTWGDDRPSAGASVVVDISSESDVYIDDLEIYEGTMDDSKLQWVDCDFEKITPKTAMVNLYVDKNARTSGNGTKNAPFKTIEDARDYIRTINGSMSGDIVVNVKGGRYELAEAIELTTADSGKNGRFVIYQPYGYDTDVQEEVVLSGGRKVTGWTQSEIAGVYKAPFEIDYLRNLYVNDKRAQRARYNKYVTPISWWDDTTNSITTKDGFVIPGDIIKNPEKATNLEIYKTATFRSIWVVKGKALASGENTIISMEQPHFYLHELANYSILDWKITDDFRLENALEFLDEPGEWYHDADAGMLYYKPRNGESISDCDVVAPVTEQLLTIQGKTLDERAENIIIRGFTFSEGAYKRTSKYGKANLQATACVTLDPQFLYTAFQYNTEGNINLVNAKNVSLYNNVIKHMGGVGITMPDGVDNCEVKGNAIYDISSSAVTLSTHHHTWVLDWRTIPRNIQIVNNIISDTGVEYGTDPAIQGYFTNGMTVSHNEILNSTYSGVCAGMTWDSSINTTRNTTIENNRIYNFGTQCQDGGGIYTLGNHPNSVIRGNFLRAFTQDIVGLYHDTGSSSFLSTGNVIELPDDSANNCLHHNGLGEGLVVTENYISNFKREGHESANYFDNYTEQGAVRSQSALSIRNASGLEAEYKGLRNVVGGYSQNTEVRRIYLQTEEQKHTNPANIKTGETLTLVTLAESKNGDINTHSAKLTYKVSDTSVLSISGNKITALSPGMATVSVTDDSGRSAQMLVTVDDEVVSFEVMTNKSYANVGEELHVNYRLKTKYTEYVGIPKKSDTECSDEGVLSIMSDGRIKAVGKGRSRIDVKMQIADFVVEGSTTVRVNETCKSYKLLGSITHLTKNDLLAYFGGNNEKNVTEKEYVKALAVILETDTDAVCKNPEDKVLTKERMIEIASDVLINIFGVASNGDSELYYYDDREQIDPRIVSKVAFAYRNGLLSWVDGATTFEPKKEIKVSDAVDFIDRFAHPQNAQYLRMEEHSFNRYGETANWLFARWFEGAREKKSQWNLDASGVEYIDISNHSTYKATDGVAIVDDELVQKIIRDSYDSSIFLMKDLNLVSGMRYTLRFSAKASSRSTSTITSTVAVTPQFDVVSGTGSMSQTTVTSSEWSHFEIPLEIPEGTDIPEDGVDIYINIRNTTLDYRTHDMLLKDISITETAKISIESSTISNDEKDVLTPVDSVYIKTTQPVNAEEVTADKFSITGAGSSISGVNMIDDTTIRIGLEGIQTDAEYTLSVSGIHGGTDSCVGILNDTLSWKTAKQSGRSGIWDFETHKNGVTPSNPATITLEQSSDFPYRGAKALKVTTSDYANVFLNTTQIGFPGFEIGKEYEVSYMIYSPDKNVKTGISKFNATGGEFVCVEPTTFAAGKWHKISGVYSPESESHATNTDLFKINVWTSGITCYIDDIEITELKKYPLTVYRPIVFSDGAPVSRISAGNNEVEMKIAGCAEDKTVLVIAAQYDSFGKLLSTTIAESAEKVIPAGKEETIRFNLSAKKGAKTRIFVVDLTDYAPMYDYIEYN